MPPSRMGMGMRLRMPRLIEMRDMVPMRGVQPGICAA